jgi:hypothetical protein
MRDRNEARGLLDMLEAEFQQNVEDLKQQERNHLRFARSAHLLLEVSRGSAPWPPMASVDSLLVDAFLIASTFNPASGAATAFQSAGRADLVRSHELQSLLGAWPGLVEENAEDERRIVKLVDERLRPYLSRHASFADAFAATTPGLAQVYGSYGGEPGRSDHRALVSSLEFRNHMVIRAAMEQLVLRENAKLRVAAERILELAREQKSH